MDPSIQTFPPMPPSTPELTVTEVETLLRDAHALAVALAELSEDARSTDGRAIVRLIKPKLHAAKAPLVRWEGTIAGAAQMEELGLRHLYDETKAIVDAEDEADTCVCSSIFPLLLLLTSFAPPV
jgi:hypothetical protein